MSEPRPVKGEIDFTEFVSACEEIGLTDWPEGTKLSEMIAKFTAAIEAVPPDSPEEAALSDDLADVYNALQINCTIHNVPEDIRPEPFKKVETQVVETQVEEESEKPIEAPEEFVKEEPTVGGKKEKKAKKEKKVKVPKEPKPKKEKKPKEPREKTGYVKILRDLILSGESEGTVIEKVKDMYLAAGKDEKKAIERAKKYYYTVVKLLAEEGKIPMPPKKPPFGRTPKDLVSTTKTVETTEQAPE
jgi:hypothetical protein